MDEVITITLCLLYDINSVDPLRILGLKTHYLRQRSRVVFHKFVTEFKN